MLSTSKFLTNDQEGKYEHGRGGICQTNSTMTLKAVDIRCMKDKSISVPKAHQRIHHHWCFSVV